MFRTLRLILLSCAGLVASCLVTAAEPTRRNFDLPAGDAETTLRLFATQAGGQFVFSAEKVAGVRTNAVKGLFTKHEALERMLQGTGLRAVLDAETGALTVDRAEASSESAKERGKCAAAAEYFQSP